MEFYGVVMRVLIGSILLTLLSGIPALAQDWINIGDNAQPIIIDQDSITPVSGGYQYLLLYDNDEGGLSYAVKEVQCSRQTMQELFGGRIINNRFVQTYGTPGKPNRINIGTYGAVAWEYFCQ